MNDLGPGCAKVLSCVIILVVLALVLSPLGAVGFIIAGVVTLVIFERTPGIPND